MKAVSGSRFAWLLLVLALAGCDDTHFQSSPGTNLSACDERFVGSWVMSNPDPNDDACETAGHCDLLVVEPGCALWHYYDDGRADEKTERDVREHSRLAFADLHGRLVLDIAVDQDPQERTARPEWTRTHRLFRYEAKANAIRLYTVDFERVRRLIGSGAAHGATTVQTRERPRRPGAPASEPPPRPTVVGRDAWVDGDAREIARIALLPGLFEAEPTFILKRTDRADIVKPVPTATSP